METSNTPKSVFKSFFSIVILIGFVIMASGSLSLIMYQYYKSTTFSRIGPEYDEDCNCYKYTDKYVGSKRTIYSNDKLKPGDYGKWNGPVVFVYETDDPRSYDYQEEVMMVDGKRDGVSKISYLYSDKVIYKCYKMGKRVDCEKSSLIEEEIVSSYEVLLDRFPWFNYVLNFHGYDDDSIKSFLDTLDIILNSCEFEPDEFEDYYSDAIDLLEETPHDSLVQTNSLLSFFEGFDEMKNAEFRMAIFDRYLTEGTTTFEHIQSKYPGYLSLFIDEGISENNFEKYCSDLDSCMDSYGELDLEDDYFIDSVDNRMYRAITYLMELEEESSVRKLKTKYVQSRITGEKLNLNDINNLISEQLSDMEETEGISNLVLYSILIYFLEGDYIQKSVKEAYLVNHDIPRVPTIATSITDTTETSGIVLQGYVVDDGGSDITTKGITWATFYSPTIEDNLLTLESNSFSGTLSGLEVGEEYYARAYTITARDTVYGNCVSFITSNFVGTETENVISEKLELYPNPAKSVVTIKYIGESSGYLSVSIINMNGQELVNKDFGISFIDGKSMEMDISILSKGLYYCLLKENSKTIAKQKLSVLK